MKKTYLKSIRGLFLAVSGLALTSSVIAQTATFNFTGGIQTFTVPCGVNSIFIQTWGAQGGSGDLGGNGVSGGAGALGGYSEGFLTVTPGDILNIFVGGQGTAPTGGFNGGANGGSTNAGGGGGATDVRFGGAAEANRIITAGGGGGGGRGGCDEGSAVGGIGGTGGAGGGGIGVNGLDSPTSGGVAGGGKGGNFGAIQGGSGAAGIGCSGFLGAPGSVSLTGTGATGGAGQTCCCSSSNSIPGGGGGGGGQIGGGGGGGGSAGTTGCSGNSKGAGGGGGSSFTGGVTSGVTNNGIWLGNGQCTISYADPLPAAPTLAAATICANQISALNISADPLATNYTWTSTGDVTIESGQGTTDITILSIGAGGTISVYASNACGDGPLSTVETITVLAQPLVGLTATMTGTFCGGQDVILTGSPAGGVYSQVSGPAAALTANIFNAPSSGAWTVDYTFTDGNGCINIATLDFVIDCMLGLDLISLEGSMTVFPNPNNGNFTIKSDVNAAGTLELFNLAGQLVHTQIIDDLSEKVIEIKDLTPGVYTMTIKSGDQLFSGKMNIVK
jgi:hypothetical protein